MEPLQKSTSKMILMAWNKSSATEEFSELSELMRAQGYQVDVVHNTTALEKQLEEYERRREIPVAFISDYYFPKVPAGILNRIVRNRFKDWTQDSRPYSIVVTHKILGADLHQFAIDSAANKMVKLADLPGGVLRVLPDAGIKSTLKTTTLPRVYAHIDDPDLRRNLGEILKVQQQHMVPVNLMGMKDLSVVKGGVILISESAMDEIELKNPAVSLEALDQLTGVVMLMDQSDSPKVFQKKLVRYSYRGALDCIEKEAGEQEIVNRTLSARRARARRNIDNQYVHSLQEEKIEMEVLEDFSKIEPACIAHDDDGLIHMANKSATLLFGYDDFQGMNIKDLHPSNYEKERREIYENFNENGMIKVETTFVKKSGVQFEALLASNRGKKLTGSGRALIFAYVQSREHSNFLNTAARGLISSASRDLDSQLEAVIAKMGKLIEGISAVHVFKKKGKFAQCDCVWEKDASADSAPSNPPFPVSMKSTWSVFEAEGREFIEDNYDENHAMKSPQIAALNEIQALVSRKPPYKFIAAPMWFGKDIIGFVLVELTESKNKDLNKPWAGEENYRRQLIRRTLSPISRMIASGIQRKREDAIRENMESLTIQEDKKRSINNITDGIAHDFNNLLQSISGHVSLLLRSVSLEQKEKHSLKSVMSAAELGASLSSRIRDLSVPSTAIGEFSLHQLIEEVSELVTSSLSSGSTPILTFDSESDFLNTDRSQVHQVFMNLFTNANDAMCDFNKEGQIYVSTKGIVNEHGQKFIQVTFKDEGPGIKKEDLFRIFEPYYSTKVESKKGAGMGLWIVSRIMRNHGGSIRVNEDSDGATFVLEWPLIEKFEETSKESSGIFSGEGTVLVVDDDVMVNESCQLLLEHLGFSVLSACDGQTAVRVYEKHHRDIDLVILDQKMPGMSGHDCLKHLVGIDQSIKVILCSGNDIRLNSWGDSENVVGVLPKPYTLKDLGKTLKNALVVQE